MACGIHLGILLVCLVHAEYVCCSWASQALSSQRPDSNRYVGFSQQGGVGHHSSVSSYPQNGLRQGSIQPSDTKPKLKAGYSQLFPRGGPAAAATPQVAPSSAASTKFVQSSSLSRPNLQTAMEASSNWVNAHKTPKRPVTGLSSAITSGNSLSKSSLKQNSYSEASWRAPPGQQGAAHAGSYPFSSSPSSSSPSSSYPSSSYPSSSSPVSSSSTLTRFGPRKAQQSSYAPMQSPPRFSSGVSQSGPIRMRTSASARGRRVSARRGNKSPRFTPQSGGALSSSMLTGPRGSSQSFSTQVGLQPRSSGSQRLSYAPSSHGSPQASWSSGGNRETSSGKRFAPTKTHNIPARFGGFAIRRLKEPANKPDVAVRKPTQVYATPSSQVYKVPSSQVYKVPSSQVYAAPTQQSMSVRPQAPGVHHVGKWQRVRLASNLGPSGVV